MQKTVRSFFTTLARMLAALAACLFCTSCEERPTKPSTPRIRWKGEDTGYTIETRSPSSNQAAETQQLKQEDNHP